MATKAYSIFLLARAASNLDQRGFHKEASKLDRILYKLADDIAIEPPVEPTQQSEDMAQRLTQALQQLGFVIRNPGTKQPNQIADMRISADGLSRNQELWQQIHDASEFLNVAPEMSISLQTDTTKGWAGITVGFFLGEQVQVTKPFYLSERQWQGLEVSLDDFIQRYIGNAISKRLAQLPKPKKNRQIASNMTEHDTFDPAIWEESGKDYREFIYRLYLRDLIPRYGDKKGKKEAKRMVNKQISSHSYFTGLMGEYVNEGSRVISVGSGNGHEQAVSPNYKWVGLEYQKNLVSMANQRNEVVGIDAENHVGSAWNGDFDAALNELPEGEEWVEQLGELPEGDALYLKHACGGLTDSSLYQAVQKGIRVIFAATCCADRFKGISHKILAPNSDYEDWEDLIYRSSKRGTEEGMKAVEEIDGLRQTFLEKNGYTVVRGWQEKEGKRTPAGSYLIAYKGH